MADEPKQGWGWPANSKKPHYFCGDRSLCCRWGYFGTMEDRPTRREDCKECAKRLTKHRKSAKK